MNNEIESLKNENAKLKFDLYSYQEDQEEWFKHKSPIPSSPTCARSPGLSEKFTTEKFNDDDCCLLDTPEEFKDEISEQSEVSIP